MATLLYTVGSSGALTSAANNLHKSNPSSSSSHLRSSLYISAGSDRSRRSSHVARARRSGLSSRTRRLEKRENKGEEAAEETGGVSSGAEIGGGVGEIEYSAEPMPKLEGLEPDFWEGPQWNALGFFVQYLWAFGILFALISAGIAVATYNEGATDFKQTPTYKESIQSRELIEEPDASNADVFEANPTEIAPSLE